DIVIIALPHADYPRIGAILDGIGDDPVAIHYVPDVFGLASLRGGIEEFETLPIIHLRESPLYGWNRVLKRGFDVVVGAAAVVAAVPRAARRDEPGRPAAGAAVVRGGLPASHAALHAAAQGEGRHHGVGADQRLARQYVDREAHRVRPLLHRALVARLRHQDPAADHLARLPQPERVLTAVLATLRGALPTERPDHARVVAALLLVLAAGLGV